MDMAPALQTIHVHANRDGREILSVQNILVIPSMIAMDMVLALVQILAHVNQVGEEINNVPQFHVMP